MTLRPYRISALFVPVLLGTALLSTVVKAQNQPAAPAAGAAPASPYGGTTVEDILVRVNDQIITRTDYDRALKEIDSEGRQRGENLQQIAEGHKDLLAEPH